MLSRPDTILEMTHEQDLIHDEVHEQAESFTGFSQSAAIGIHDRLDMVMRPFTIALFGIGFPEEWINLGSGSSQTSPPDLASLVDAFEEKPFIPSVAHRSG